MQLFSEMGEAEAWMDEKKPQLTSADLGKDEDSCQALIKKLDALELDIDAFRATIDHISNTSHKLVSEEHYERDVIATKQTSVVAKYDELLAAAAQRRRALLEKQELYRFFRETDEVAKWIKEQEAVAGSEDYGTDLEHVQQLQKKFDDFERYLAASDERIVQVNTKADQLTEKGHAETDAIEQRRADVNEAWKDVKELAEARRDALDGAKQVHAFVGEADDTIEWIQEKEIWVSSEDYGHDLEGVRGLIAKHDGFEQDLAAISSKVENITAEAEKLLLQFPDAQEHIASKHEEMVRAWNTLLEKAQTRKDKLQVAESLQMYFNDYRELL